MSGNGESEVDELVQGGFSSCSIDGWEERRPYPTTDMVGKWQVDPGQTGGRRKSTTRLEDHK